MGKVLIASFDREEEQDFEELVLFLKEKGYRDFTGMASADNVLKYNDLKINPKYRTVRKQGEDIKLTNYEFDILYLLAKRPGRVVREIRRGRSVQQIAADTGMAEDLAEQICRMYLTHPGVDAAGIMTKLGL